MNAPWSLSPSQVKNTSRNFIRNSYCSMSWMSSWKSPVKNAQVSPITSGRRILRGIE